MVGARSPSLRLACGIKSYRRWSSCTCFAPMASLMAFLFRLPFFLPDGLPEGRPYCLPECLAVRLAACRYISFDAIQPTLMHFLGCIASAANVDGFCLMRDKNKGDLIPNSAKQLPNVTYMNPVALWIEATYVLLL